MNTGATISPFTDRFAAFARPGVTAAGDDGGQINELLDQSIGQFTKHGSPRLDRLDDSTAVLLGHIAIRLPACGWVFLRHLIEIL